MFVLQKLKVKLKRDEVRASIGTIQQSTNFRKSELNLARLSNLDRRRNYFKSILNYFVLKPIEFICKMTIPFSDS